MAAPIDGWMLTGPLVQEMSLHSCVSGVRGGGDALLRVGITPGYVAAPRYPPQADRLVHMARGPGLWKEGVDEEGGRGRVTGKKRRAECKATGGQDEKCSRKATWRKKRVWAPQTGKPLK